MPATSNASAPAVYHRASRLSRLAAPLRAQRESHARDDWQHISEILPRALALLDRVNRTRDDDDEQEAA